MTKNIGIKDRVIRFVFGVLCFGAIFIFDMSIVFRFILIILGFFGIFQAVFSWCAWYALIGKNTCPIQNNQSN